MAESAKAAAALEAPPQTLIDDVNEVLRRVSPFPPDPLEPCMDLRQELGLTDELKASLSNSFQDIARGFNPSARITDDECRELETVEDAHALVSEEANFTFTKVCS
jgi:hypothetical protein